MYKLHFYQDRKKEWRWRLSAGNGRIVADSGEGYTRLRTCYRMAHRIFPWLRFSETGRP